MVLGDYIAMAEMGVRRLKDKVQRIPPRFWTGGLDGYRTKGTFLKGSRND